MQWEPIETLDTGAAWAAFGYWARTGDRKSWVVYTRHAVNPPAAATHWMPLPPPPEGPSKP
jgi:hypothetical protein